ncbi:riboflavin synthase [Marihabitans asiaticum]|uniref:Riboflavin synthase n=1 Tax=Marihabitans asiaticum TaxID=415218 RepID=A0A560WE26_9MICO|nr:riboflavin synthase [Marihabitans asiaticum]TWD15933.1 riboflavin synthase alpha chain [Marihabitans asiaticum]
MFTGIIEEIGTVRDLSPGRARLSVAARTVLGDIRHGCSIAVAGVCLTVVEHDSGGFVADVMGETLRWTTLGALTTGDQVNLERAVRVDGRLDGHVVQGHVDGVAQVTDRVAHDRWEVLTLTAPESLRGHLARKGAVTLDGTSLTVSAVTEDGFEVSLIPETLAATTLGRLRPGDRVNLETDVLAKYVERLLAASGAPR